MEENRVNYLFILICAIAVVIICFAGYKIYSMNSNSGDKQEVKKKAKEKEEVEEEEISEEGKSVEEVLNYLCENLDVGGKSYYLSPYHGCYDYVCYFSKGEGIIFKEDCETELIEEVDNPEGYTVEEYINNI